MIVTDYNPLKKTEIHESTEGAKIQWMLKFIDECWASASIATVLKYFPRKYLFVVKSKQ